MTERLNDPDTNARIDAALRKMRERAIQQPNSYKMLFDEAIELATEQFMRAMAAEQQLYRLGAVGEAAPGARRCVKRENNAPCPNWPHCDCYHDDKR